MGLDVSFYASATMVHGEKHPRALTEPQEGPGEECWDTYTVAYVNPDFRAQADGIIPQSCWETGKRDLHIGQPYSSYGRFRAWLAKTALNVEPEVVWNAPEQWWDRPFVRMIHFSDCEGIIGPESSQILAAEFERMRSHVHAAARALPRPFDQTEESWEGNVDRFLQQYDRWREGFALVGPTGFTVYR
jgi:hypothetical protein